MLKRRTIPVRELYNNFAHGLNLPNMAAQQVVTASASRADGTQALRAMGSIVDHSSAIVAPRSRSSPDSVASVDRRPAPGHDDGEMTRSCEMLQPGARDSGFGRRSPR
jgi:hypothetical protein